MSVLDVRKLISFSGTLHTISSRRRTVAFLEILFRHSSPAPILATIAEILGRLPAAFSITATWVFRGPVNEIFNDCKFGGAHWL